MKQRILIGKAPSYLYTSIRGKILASPYPISFFGDVDPRNGTIVNPNVPIWKQSIRNRILVMPHGRGSTVGSYVLYSLSRRGLAPKCILSIKPDTITLVGCIIAEIPLAYGFPEEILDFNNYLALVNIRNGRATVEILDQ